MKRQLDLLRILVFAIVTGLLSSLASILFYLFIKTYTGYEYYVFGIDPLEPRVDAGFNLLALSFMIASFIGGSIIIYYLPRVRGAGADSALYAYHLYDARIDIDDLFFKIAATSLFIGSGVPVGLFGPIIFIGGGVGALVSRISGLTYRYRRRLFLSGVSSALSAVFHSPLGAIIYSLELPYRRDIESQHFLSAVVASITGYLVSSILDIHVASRGLWGIDAAYNVYAVLLVVLAGIVAGLFSRIYSRIYVFSRRRLMLGNVWRLILLITLNVAVISIIYLFIPLGLGSGRKILETILIGDYSSIASFITLFIVLLVIKSVYSPFIIGSGVSGGLFAPAIVSGAIIGVLTYYPLNYLFGYRYYRLYIVASMASFYGGVSTTPIGTAVIVSEITGNYVYIPLIMFSTIISRELVGSDYLYRYQRERRLLYAIYNLRDLYEYLIRKKPWIKNVRLSRYLVYASQPLTYRYEGYLKDPLKIYRLFAFTRYNVILLINGNNRVVGAVSYNSYMEYRRGKSGVFPVIEAEPSDEIGSVIRRIIQFNTRYIAVHVDDEYYVLSVEDLYRGLLIDSIS